MLSAELCFNKNFKYCPYWKKYIYFIIMFKIAKQKIENTKIQQDPFPFLFVRNLISNKDLKRLNKVLPNYDAIVNDEILYQVNQNLKNYFTKIKEL